MTEVRTPHPEDSDQPDATFGRPDLLYVLRLVVVAIFHLSAANAPAEHACGVE